MITAVIIATPCVLALLLALASLREARNEAKAEAATLRCLLEDFRVASTDLSLATSEQLADELGRRPLIKHVLILIRPDAADEWWTLRVGGMCWREAAFNLDMAWQVAQKLS